MICKLGSIALILTLLAAGLIAQPGGTTARQAPVPRFRLELRRPAPEREVMKKPPAFLARRRCQELLELLLREASQQVAAQIRF